MTPPKRYFILFQCLSRQTIKWNASVPRWIRDLENGFQCLSRQTIKWNPHSASCWPNCSRWVSMPQSANDQVEPSTFSPAAPPALRFNASVGKRSSGTSWRGSGQRARWVSMPQSANDQVELRTRDSLTEACAVSMPQSANDQVEPTVARWNVDLAVMFQCLSRQTIKWNQQHNQISHF